MFNDCISEINNTQVDNDKDIDIAMPMYNLTEFSNSNSKTSESLWQYYRYELAIYANDAIIDFPANNNINNGVLFKFKTKITRKTEKNDKKHVKLMVPLKYLSNFWRTVEMSLINCEINLILTWSGNYFMIANPVANQIPVFALTDTRLYNPVVSLSTQYNAKLLQ